MSIIGRKSRLRSFMVLSVAWQHKAKVAHGARNSSCEQVQSQLGPCTGIWCEQGLDTSLVSTG